MEFIKEDKNRWYFINQTIKSDPIKIYLSLQNLGVSIDYPTEPPTFLQIIAESLARDAEELKKEFTDQIKENFIDGLLFDGESKYGQNYKNYEEYFTHISEHTIFIQRSGVFINEKEKLSDIDLKKIANETRLLYIEFELFKHLATSQIMSHCYGIVIDPFMRRFQICVENKYHEGEPFIECS
jgi:hypothetical protein